jgi:hypothetical protein
MIELVYRCTLDGSEHATKEAAEEHEKIRIMANAMGHKTTAQAEKAYRSLFPAEVAEVAEVADEDIPSWLLDNNECPPSREEFIEVANRLTLRRIDWTKTEYIENVSGVISNCMDDPAFIMCDSIRNSGTRRVRDWWIWDDSGWRVYQGDK